MTRRVTLLALAALGACAAPGLALVGPVAPYDAAADAAAVGRLVGNKVCLGTLVAPG